MWSRCKSDVSYNGVCSIVDWLSEVLQCKLKKKATLGGSVEIFIFFFSFSDFVNLIVKIGTVSILSDRWKL